MCALTHVTGTRSVRVVTISRPSTRAETKTKTALQERPCEESGGVARARGVEARAAVSSGGRPEFGGCCGGRCEASLRTAAAAGRAWQEASTEPCYGRVSVRVGTPGAQRATRAQEGEVGGSQTRLFSPIATGCRASSSNASQPVTLRTQKTLQESGDPNTQGEF